MKKNNKQEKNAAALAGTMAVGGVGTYALGKSVEKDFMKLVKKPEDAKAIADKLTGTIVKEIYVPKKIINIVQK